MEIPALTCFHQFPKTLLTSLCKKDTDVILLWNRFLLQQNKALISRQLMKPQQTSSDRMQIAWQFQKKNAFFF